MIENQLRIFVLWVIRENQNISFAELSNKVNENKALTDDATPGTYRDAEQLTENAVSYLLRCNLITASDANLRSARFQVIDGLAYLQQLFGLSLSTLAQHGYPIASYPTFGRPLSKNDGEWANVFVLMPFRPELMAIYNKHILPVVQRLGLSCKKGDDFPASETIIDEIWASIYHAHICIADCTGSNPNVFYELGIAHTLGKPCFLIAQSIKDIPFDVRHRRFIIYENSENGLKQLEKTLTDSLKNEIKRPSRGNISVKLS